MAKIDQQSTKFYQSSPGTRPSLAQFRRKLTRFRSILTPAFDQLWPELVELRQNMARLRLAGFRSNLGHLRKRSDDYIGTLSEKRSVAGGESSSGRTVCMSSLTCARRTRGDLSRSESEPTDTPKDTAFERRRQVDLSINEGDEDQPAARRSVAAPCGVGVP